MKPFGHSPIMASCTMKVQILCVAQKNADIDSCQRLHTFSAKNVYIFGKNVCNLFEPHFYAFFALNSSMTYMRHNDCLSRDVRPRRPLGKTASTWLSRVRQPNSGAAMTQRLLSLPLRKWKVFRKMIFRFVLLIEKANFVAEVLLRLARMSLAIHIGM